jgi:hypothetical protein
VIKNNLNLCNKKLSIMGIIRIPLRFEGSVGEKNVYALFDNGATFSCLRDDIANEIEVPSKLRRPMEVVTASEGRALYKN